MSGNNHRGKRVRPLAGAPGESAPGAEAQVSLEGDQTLSDPPGENHEDLTARGDAELYRVKHSGHPADTRSDAALRKGADARSARREG